MIFLAMGIIAHFVFPPIAPYFALAWAVTYMMIFTHQVLSGLSE